jgi:hypothetical protein
MQAKLAQNNQQIEPPPLTVDSAKTNFGVEEGSFDPSQPLLAPLATAICTVLHTRQKQRIESILLAFSIFSTALIRSKELI